MSVSDILKVIISAILVASIGVIYVLTLLRFRKERKFPFILVPIIILSGLSLGIFVIRDPPLPPATPIVVIPTETVIPIAVKGLSTYMVMPSDELWTIASSYYGTSIEDIVYFNNLEPGSVLRPGDYLFIPHGSDEDTWEVSRKGIEQVSFANSLIAGATSSSTPSPFDELKKMFISDNALMNAEELIGRFRSRCLPETIQWEWTTVDAYLEENKRLRVIAEVDWKLDTCAVFPAELFTESYDLHYILTDIGGTWFVTDFIFIPSGSAITPGD